MKRWRANIIPVIGLVTQCFGPTGQRFVVIGVPITST
jgi:hypothetical protein